MAYSRGKWNTGTGRALSDIRVCVLVILAIVVGYLLQIADGVPEWLRYVGAGIGVAGGFPVGIHLLQLDWMGPDR